MIKSEYESFIKLGGVLYYHDLIEDKFQEIKACSSFKDIPEDSEQRQVVLEKVALTTIAQDHVHIINLITKTKQALHDGDLAKAKFYIDCMFN